MEMLIMSCDKYKCLKPGFIQCLDKYYSNHPKTRFVYGNECWSKRYREAVEKSKEEYILTMLDDFYIRKPVNEDLINEALETMQQNKNIAVINFEKDYRPSETFMPNWNKQFNNQIYLHSCQPSIWRKEALLENLQKDEDAWSWETTKVSSDKIFLINKDKDIIDIGYNHTLNWGISRGHITNEFQEFLEKEGIDLKWQNFQL